MKHTFLSKTKIPNKIPKNMRRVVERLKKAKNQKQCLRMAHEAMSQRYFGRHMRTITHPLPIFSMDASKLWNTKGFMHCHNINWLLRILLVKSGFFKNRNIVNHWTVVWVTSPHQYLRIKMDDGVCVNVDVWGATFGVKLGQHAK
ncbi:MAG: hypothetical protein U9O20_03500 [Patescibacteria group bacterium]|nr:hypothetical protein [Patescibacteria group bacterium]